MIVAGIGCRRGCQAGPIVALVRAAEARSGRIVDRLAAPEFKRDEAGLHRAAADLGIALELLPHAVLAAEQRRCVSTSVAASRATGLASVAEGAALAAAGASGRLILPRIDGVGVSCALAASDGI